MKTHAVRKTYTTGLQHCYQFTIIMGKPESRKTECGITLPDTRIEKNDIAEDEDLCKKCFRE